MTDYMHAFDLYTPASLEDAAKLLGEHGKDAWVVAGGKDSFDWFKDRHKQPKSAGSRSFAASATAATMSRSARRPR